LKPFFQGKHQLTESNGVSDLKTLVPDFGIGNMASVIRMSNKLGFDCSVAQTPMELHSAAKIILAGVGAFDQGMIMLEQGWRDALDEAVMVRKVPVLGICLGMQLLCRRSEEGRLPGLGWVDADVVRFHVEAHGLCVPHMGWNMVRICRENSILPASQEEQRFYFVHSYHVVCFNPSEPIAYTEYGGDFVAALQHDNIFGVQFHPEKSHRFGMALMKRFLEI
jgi:imidazole glycerol-phosphate synthase subunit HisH